MSQEESIECSDNQKEENIDRQVNIEKIKREIKEENIEKEVFSAKEVIGILIVYVCVSFLLILNILDINI